VFFYSRSIYGSYKSDFYITLDVSSNTNLFLARAIEISWELQKRTVAVPPCTHFDMGQSECMAGMPHILLYLLVQLEFVTESLQKLALILWC
jgi:hypothetical protein